MVKVLVASKIHENGLKLLKDNGIEVTYVEEPPEEKLIELIKGHQWINS